MAKEQKEYRGFVWQRDDDSKPGKRIVVLASDPVEAMKIAKQRYGEDTIISLSNEEDANSPR